MCLPAGILSQALSVRTRDSSTGPSSGYDENVRQALADLIISVLVRHRPRPGRPRGPIPREPEELWLCHCLSRPLDPTL